METIRARAPDRRQSSNFFNDARVSKSPHIQILSFYASPLDVVTPVGARYSMTTFIISILGVMNGSSNFSECSRLLCCFLILRGYPPSFITSCLTVQSWLPHVWCRQWGSPLHILILDLLQHLVSTPRHAPPKSYACLPAR